MYHYGGNNPIKYTDPTGEAIAVIPFIAPTVIAGAKAIGAWLASLFVVGTVATAVGKGGKAAGFIAKNGDEIAAATKRVFWTGMGDNGTKAANWVKQNGGITLEMTEAAKNLPDWTPATASKWDAASLDFAKESIGDVTVLVGPGGIRDSSTFSRVEFSELLNNKNVDSINFVYIE